MRGIALNCVGGIFQTKQAYLEYLYNSLAPFTGNENSLAVLPGHLALLLSYCWGDLGEPHGFEAAFSAFLRLPDSWADEFVAMHGEAAHKLGISLVAGTVPTRKKGCIFNTSYLFTPDGNVAGCQYQTHLSRQEQTLGLSRGESISVFPTAFGRLGIVVGTDAWYPETGRILALQGVEAVCHCGALPAGDNKWLQLSGMWSQVQQNQFFCVESQLAASFAGENFLALSLIHAPCEMTEGYSGILAGGPSVTVPAALLDNNQRLEAVRNYPLLELLNPAAYSPLWVPTGGNKNEA